MIKKKVKKKAKAGNSKNSVAERKLAFASAYIANGQNGVQAAITAGFSKNGAATVANRLLRLVQIRQIIDDANKKASLIAGLTVERTLKELARLAYADPRKLYDKKGNLIPVHMLDDDTAAAVASVEVDEIWSEDNVTGRTKKIKWHNKAQALDMAMKHHQLYAAERHDHTGNIIINMDLLDEKA